MYLLIAALICGIVASVGVRRTGTRVSGWIRLAGSAMAGVGALVIMAGSVELEDAFESRAWPSTSGLILRNDIVGERASHPNIVYRYIVDRDTFLDSTDLDQPSFGGKRKRREVALKRSAIYIRGDTLSVYYDPQDPVRSTISTSPLWSAAP